MIFDLLTPPQGPRGGGQKFFAVARPIHVSNSHTKFGWISSNGLGDSITDRRRRLQYPRGDNYVFQSLQMAVQILIKCHLMLHFIWVFTVSTCIENEKENGEKLSYKVIFSKILVNNVQIISNV